MINIQISEQSGLILYFIGALAGYYYARNHDKKTGVYENSWKYVFNNFSVNLIIWWIILPFCIIIHIEFLIKKKIKNIGI